MHLVFFTWLYQYTNHREPLRKQKSKMDIIC